MSQGYAYRRGAEQGYTTWICALVRGMKDHLSMAQKQKQPDERREFDLYRIALDKEWALADFSHFPRVYDQVYAFLFALEAEFRGRNLIVYHTFSGRIRGMVAIAL